MKKPPQISLKLLCGFVAGFAILFGIGHCAWEDVRSHHVAVQDRHALEDVINPHLWEVVASFPSDEELECTYRHYPAFVQLRGVIQARAVEFTSKDGMPFAVLRWPGFETAGFGKATGGGLLYRFNSFSHPDLHSELEMTDKREFKLTVLIPRD